jgi:peptidyl-tRNA hydrolase, PTH2 family
MEKDDELVMYIVFNGGVTMSKGKIAAQAGHAVQLVTQDIVSRMGFGHERVVAARWAQWCNDGITKVALRAPDQEKYEELFERLEDAGLTLYGIADEGRTEVEPGSKTCFAVEPLRRGYMRQFVGELPLL